MNSRRLLSFALLSIVPIQPVTAQENHDAAPRHLTVEEAVALAMKHNHVVRIAAFKVEEKEHAKEVARSSYFPLLRNDSGVLRVTDTQFIGIPAGSLGIVDGTLIPERSVTLNQGGKTFITSGTSLTQPLMQLLRVKSANDMAQAELTATRDKARQTENTVALAVHQLYYRILITQAHRQTALEKIRAADDLNRERVQQVKFGSALEEAGFESQAQVLQAKQDLLTIDLQLSDLTLQLNDIMGLPLTTALELDSAVKQVTDQCERERCVQIARESHPEIAEARAGVEKASAAVRFSKREYLPDVEVFARESYQNNVPFLARNFGTFGVHVGYDIFDGGKKRAAVREHSSQLAQARENLARVTEEVELRVQTAYNKLDRTRQMVRVSEELLASRTEARRVLLREVREGAALPSQLDTAATRELDAKTSLLQSQLQFIEAQDEMTEAMGLRPE